MTSAFYTRVQVAYANIKIENSSSLLPISQVAYESREFILIYDKSPFYVKIMAPLTRRKLW